ncbi:hypothetical protein TrLO_g4797 [Triparma laevis f. longispina]|uniref:Uncharacterized protein n=1 Tax=Triparma laevis f. longispina TaxID=1714387 RepID=A0A9W7EAD3_9STRA|nr:hypothetical protein TrLO_g4797 [Triparma laevis f. longispina]
MIRQITDAQVSQTLTPALAIESQKAAFTLPSEVPSRIILHQLVTDSTLFKPAAITTPSGNVHVGMKVVSVRPANAEIGLPTVPGTILMLDDTTGIVNSIISATLLTAIRTAAGSAIASLALRGKKSNAVLTVFGAGMQGVEHVRHLLHAFPIIKKVNIVNRTKPRAEAAIVKLKEEYPGQEYCCLLLSDNEGIKEAVSSSDIICLCTNSSTPLFPPNLLKPDAHVNGVGSYTPGMQEIGVEDIQSFEIVVVDSFGAKTVGDIAKAVEEGKFREEELVELKTVLEEEKVREGRTFFKSVGVASQDIAAAGFLIEALDSE